MHFDPAPVCSDSALAPLVDEGIYRALSLVDASILLRDSIVVNVIANGLAVAADALSSATRVQRGVAPSACVMTGPGLMYCKLGTTTAAATNNRILVECRDECGVPVSGLEDADVTLSVHSDAGHTVSVGDLISLSDATFEFAYVLDGSFEDKHVTLQFEAFGEPIPPRRIKVSRCCLRSLYSLRHSTL